jgi:outer membrane protein
MNKVLSAALIAGAVTFSGSAFCYEKGDLILRVGAATVDPDGDGYDLGGYGNVQADEDTQLGITGTYMLTNNWGIGVLAATPFSHDIELDGTKIGETKHLPPTVTAQYFFNNSSDFTPYVGAGINYTNFFEEETAVADELELDDSWGLALEAGVDWKVDNNWLVSAQIWYLDIEPSATLTNVNTGPATGATASFDVELDPWVYMIGVGYKF